jgi:sortase A
MWLPPAQTPTPSSLPDYPIPSPTGQLSTGPDGGPADSSAITRIVIPAMNLDAVVKFVPFDGKTWLIGGLRQEVAWMGDTSWPGLGGNTGLAGHVDLADGSDGPFWNLNQLKTGDEVILYAGDKVYKYKVRQKVEVDETDMSVVQPSTEPQITLITCTGWDAGLRVYLRRLVVFADLTTVSAQ